MTIVACLGGLDQLRNRSVEISYLWEWRIALNNPLVIEWRVLQDGAQWGFYMATDSPNQSKRILSVLLDPGRSQLEVDGGDTAVYNKES